MAKTEAQKRAQKKYMESHTWKRVPVDMLPEDYAILREAAEEENLPTNTYIKKAISEKSGRTFSWDRKQNKKETEE